MSGPSLFFRQQKRGVKVLCLTRKIGELILIGKDISIRILGVSGNVVRLGVEAPPEVHILRNELKDVPSKEEKEAIELRKAGYDAVPCRFCKSLKTVHSGVQWVCDTCGARYEDKNDHSQGHLRKDV